MSELLNITTKILSDKLARDITVIDMTAANPYTDYFVICTANNARQAGALADYTEDAAEKNGYHVRMKEGVDSPWVLVDIGEVVVHIFTEDARKQYRLEALWADQPQMHIE